MIFLVLRGYDNVEMKQVGQSSCSFLMVSDDVVFDFPTPCSRALVSGLRQDEDVDSARWAPQG